MRAMAVLCYRGPPLARRRTGGRPRAEQGDLTLICGGDSAILERCRPILETMGTIFHCGWHGPSGQARQHVPHVDGIMRRSASTAPGLAEARSMRLVQRLAS
jgi:NAD binding domain of 6-phosphogluconate dehydrogenase